MRQETAADGALVKDFYDQTAFVARRYWELQGLRSVLLGCAAMLAGGIGIATWGPEPGVVDSMSFLAVFVLLPIPGMLWLDRCYASTFGCTEPPAAIRRWTTYILPGCLVGLMACERALGLNQMTLFFAAFASYEFWIVVRDWPRRSHHLVGAAAAAVACAVQLTSPAPDGTSMLACFFVVGAAIVVTGTRDHQLLTTLLRSAPRNVRAGGTYGDAV